MNKKMFGRPFFSINGLNIFGFSDLSPQTFNDRDFCSNYKISQVF